MLTLKLPVYNLISHHLGFPGDTVIRESAYQCREHKRCGFDPWARDAGSILGSGRSLGIGKGIPL